MAADPSQLSFQARFVFPVSSAPLAGGTITVSGSKIVDVEPNRAGRDVHDLGNVAILPGLVNVHTHLEFSDLPSPLGAPGMPLPDWIRQVVTHRGQASDDGWAAIARGLRESLACGTTTLGDIATSDWRQRIVQADGSLPGGDVGPPPNTTVFHESIAPTRDRVAGAVATAEKFLSAQPFAHELPPALSPHAPYTVHPRLLAELVELSRRFQVPLAMHLAESREELELLQAGSGPFCELLRNLNAWDPQPEARYAHILDYLEQLARAPRALVIHGNYLNKVEIRFLAAHADTMTVVYCPRTHDFFRHQPYPLASMLAAGVALALGTDSRASNPDLSLWAEMKFVAQRHPGVRRSAVLELGTSRGAAALGLAARVGTIEPGKLADFIVVELDDAEARDPHDLLFGAASRVVQTWVRGQCAWRAAAAELGKPTAGNS